MTTLSIPLSSRKYPGLFALVDEECYDLLRLFQWSPSYSGIGKKVYAKGTRLNENGIGQQIVKMHHLVLNTMPPILVDHRDGNGLNNTRENLRPATVIQNSANRGATSRNKSGYKGVSWMSAAGKWQASIRYDGKSHHLGLFTNADEAARAYDIAAYAQWLSFAWLNFPSAPRL